MPLSSPGKFKLKAVGNSYGGDGSAVNLTGDFCTLIGYQAGKDISTDNVTVIGSGALSAPTAVAGGTTVIGSDSAQVMDGGADCTIIGSNVAPLLTTGYSNTLIGRNAAFNLTTGYRNTFVGANAGVNSIESFENTAIGYGSGRWNLNASGTRNVFVGSNCGGNSGLATSAWNNNTAIGAYAMGGLGSGNNLGNDRCVAVGFEAIGKSNGNDGLVAVGYRTLKDAPGIMNTAIGNQAGENMTATTGSNAARNTLLGAFAGQNINTGSDNVMIGMNAGLGDSASNRIIAIGTTFPNAIIESDSVFIGHNARPFRTGGDLLVISNNNRASDQPLISGEFSNGNVGIGNRYFGGGAGMLSIRDATILPIASNSLGGLLYINNGALEYRGKGGTVTVLAPT